MPKAVTKSKKKTPLVLVKPTNAELQSIGKIAMAHDIDPKTRAMTEVGDIAKIDVFNNQVLIAVYIRPEKTRGGITLSTGARDEDKYQSKVGLILKTGPDAFIDEDGRWFKSAKLAVGDWIVFRPSDGWNIEVNGRLCRMLDDTSVRMKIDHPDRVW